MPKRQGESTAYTTGQPQEDALDRPRAAAGDGPAERPCMTCGATFLSEGWHNRMCRRCAKRGQTLGTYAARGASRARRRGQD